jgi:predicted anti-sigma-YlaC factor YlaD
VIGLFSYQGIQQMGDNLHLTEEQLNRYLDGEMMDIEYAEVAAHLTACAACRAELAALQELFLALDELAPAPDLVPAVRACLAAGRPTSLWRRRLLPTGQASAAPWRRWIAIALQAAAVVALLVWAATRPYAYWPRTAETLQGTVRSLWSGLSAGADGLVAGLPAWMVDLPGAVAAWPEMVWGTVQGWVTRLFTQGGPSLSPVHIIVLVAVLVVGGLVGNWLLLRRAALNSRVAR